MENSLSNFNSFFFPQLQRPDACTKSSFALQLKLFQPNVNAEQPSKWDKE